MSDMGWHEAIVAVLGKSNEPMHYTDIADAIISQGLRTSVGATPANTVACYISYAKKQLGKESPFDKTAPGYYCLRSVEQMAPVSTSNTPSEYAASMNAPDEDAATIIVEENKNITGLINALGMYWSRDKINWCSGTPKLLGKQTAGSQPVDFSDQHGVYLLYDRSEVIYVGRTTDQGIGIRLKQHTFDRLNGRWDRFSWFGVYPVSESGDLKKDEQQYDRQLLIATMEALLIESVEPSQNRRRGDEFRAVEFLQTEDPEIELNRMRALIGQMQTKLGI
jgi:hypothetical protein